MASHIPHDFSENVADFWVQPAIKYIDNPTDLAFQRDYVSAYCPVIIRNKVAHWKALHKWNMDYLSATCKGTYEINVTPDGRADACKEVDGEECFTYPAEIHMTMSDFGAMLTAREDGDAVPYLSQQDNNLSKHFPELKSDIENGLPLANAVFNCEGPEATNLWIGDERSTSSLHKDFFENMYVVISGTKTFTLYPPTDTIYFNEKTFPTRRYEHNNRSSQRIKKSDLKTTESGCSFASLSWVDFDPDDPHALLKNPAVINAHPIKCSVRAGEILYIPAMWYHQVSQSEVTIACNFWYEQRFDFRYVFFQLLNGMKRADCGGDTMYLQDEDSYREDEEEELQHDGGSCGDDSIAEAGEPLQPEAAANTIPEE